ncbi:MAG: hypothetical protein M0Z67_15230 [Nitrospiraceae bacterium]|nr:hypothetical protein [Nitrospiraceae bacterium]
MRPSEVIKRTFSVRLVSVTVLCIVLSVVLSSLLFYYSMDRDIGETYGQKIRMLGFYKTELVTHSLFIFSGFALLAFFGISASGVLQTHRVVGPLVRTRLVAKQLADGKFDVTVRFRDGDAVPLIADSLNQFARAYGDRYAVLDNSIRDMYRDAVAMGELIQQGDIEGAFALRVRIVERMRELNSVLEGIKL